MTIFLEEDYAPISNTQHMKENAETNVVVWDAEICTDAASNSNQDNLKSLYSSKTHITLDALKEFKRDKHAKVTLFNERQSFWL